MPVPPHCLKAGYTPEGVHGFKGKGEHYDCIDVPGDNYPCGEMEIMYIHGNNEVRLRRRRRAVS